jgi:hypothetical protein
MNQKHQSNRRAWWREDRTFSDMRLKTKIKVACGRPAAFFGRRRLFVESP